MKSVYVLLEDGIFTLMWSCYSALHDCTSTSCTRVCMYIYLHKDTGTTVNVVFAAAGTDVTRPAVRRAPVGALPAAERRHASRLRHHARHRALRDRHPPARNLSRRDVHVISDRLHVRQQHQRSAKICLCMCYSLMRVHCCCQDCIAIGRFATR